MQPQQPYQQQPYPTYPQQVPGQHGYQQQTAWQQPPAGLPTNGYPQLPHQQRWPPLPPTAVTKQRKAWPWIVGGLVALLVVMIVGAAGLRGASVPTSTTAAPAATSGSRPSTQPAAAAAPAPAPQPSQPPKAITARDWAKIAKDPASHVGEAIIVYGEVTQFDAATGADVFRANVDGIKHPVSYGYADYPTNTVLAGNGVDLGDLVQGDLFQAEAIVTGSISYETTMGGTLTAPQLSVSKVKVIGSTKH